MQYEIKFTIKKSIPAWECQTDDKKDAEKYAYSRSRDWFESLDPSDIDIEIVEVEG